MTAGPVRRALHAAHAITAVVLIITGLLIMWPELRSRTIGGYGREIGNIHNYVGIAFGVAPLLAWLWVRRGLLSDPWQRIAHGDLRARWRRTHIVVTIASSALLTLTGAVMWVGVDLPVEYWDAAAEVHSICHWILTASLPLHVVVAWRKMVENLRLLLGGEPPDLFEFAEDEDHRD